MKYLGLVNAADKIEEEVSFSFLPPYFSALKRSAIVCSKANRVESDIQLCYVAVASQQAGYNVTVGSSILTRSIRVLNKSMFQIKARFE